MASIFIRTIIIYLLLSLLLKIMGKRQIGELEVQELVSTLLISEIASIPIGDNDVPLLAAVIPILFISLLEIFISALKNKWHGLKRVVEGVPVYIIYRGRIIEDALTSNRISINEVITEMRIQGIGSLEDVYYGILEQNGKLSLIEEKDKDNYAHSVIVDTKVDRDTLRRLGYNGEWLEKQLRKAEVTADGVFLMTVKDDGTVNIIRKENTE